MPSDSKKLRADKKKAAAKVRGGRPKKENGETEVSIPSVHW